MAKKVRIGVVGASMGRWHIECYKTHPHAEVVGLAEIDDERLEDVGTRFEVPGLYPSLEDMLASEKLDVISIATPNRLHKPMTIAAFEAGCHVLCEKPMAMSATEARAMIQASEQAKKRLMINFSYRFTPAAQALKREVDRGTLGETYFGRTVWLRRLGLPRFGGWFGQKDLSGGGPLIDLGVHKIDLALWLMGYPKPEWVMASTYDHIGRALAEKEGKTFDVEDLAVALIRFKNGATLEAEASWASHIKEGELIHARILGTKGGLVHRNIDEGYEFEAEVYTDKDGELVTTVPEPPKDAPASAMAHFVDCISKDKPHIATGEEGLLVMELLDAIYESADRKEPVRIK